MAIREKLQANKLIGFTVGAVLCLVAAAALACEFWPTTGHSKVTTIFFSDDDGKTFYSDSIFNFPPYDHLGKQAERAFVYQCNQGRFVGFLLRYKPDARKRLEDNYNKAQAGGSNLTQAVLSLMSTDAIRYGGVEIKLPGQNKWGPMPGVFPHINSPDGSTCFPVDP